MIVLIQRYAGSGCLRFGGATDSGNASAWQTLSIKNGKPMKRDGQRAERPKPCSAAMRRSALIVVAVSLIALPAHAEPLVLAWPSPGDGGDWEIEEFEGETQYRVVETDGRRVMEADSAATASSLYLEREIDLTQTPILEWSWRIEKPLAVDDERVKDGDDYAARVYVVAPGEGWFGMPRAVNYVWANRAEVGESWPNPFTSKVMMVAVHSGDGDAGTWQTYRRNVRDDFRRLFGMEVDELEGIAVMTDSDNCGQSARAWYGEIAFHPE